MTSTIKVNNIQNQCGANIINESSNTITIGASGDTVTLASGASQSGFGREGSVDWQTGSIKTSTFTAVSGEGYFINSGSSITANLPAGSAGAIVAFSDYARNFSTYNFIVSPNGSEKIGGVAADARLTVDGQAATFVYVDSTKGWINVQNAEDTEEGRPPFIAATGGTVLTNGDFKTHIFTGPGTFCVTSAGTPAGSTTVDYVVIAGGGSGGVGCAGGGGGAGGFRLANSVGCIPAPTMSPLVAPNSPSPAGLPVSVQGYPITVGGGGAGKPNSPLSPGIKGSDSIFSTITSTGGGFGGGQGVPSPTAPPSCRTGGTGGSGGGGAHSTAAGGAGNTPPVSPAQGQNGGNSVPGSVGGDDAAGGGGGAGAAADGSTNPTGGIGSFVADTFFGPTAPSYGEPGPVSSTRYFAGGGGGGARGAPTPAGSSDGGIGGGGNGARGPSGSGGPESSGTANTGGGGGGAVGPGGGYTPSGGGGSGIVMIRYKFQ